MISGTSIGVVVPDAMGAFGVGQDKAQLMATAFCIAMTVSQLLSVCSACSANAERFHRVAVVRDGSVVWTTADDFSLIKRVVQGVGAGLIQTQTMLALFKRSPRRRGMAMDLGSWHGVGDRHWPALGASLGTAVWAFSDIRTHFHSDVFASTQSVANAASQEMLAAFGGLEQFGFAVPTINRALCTILGKLCTAPRAVSRTVSSFCRLASCSRSYQLVDVRPGA